MVEEITLVNTWKTLQYCKLNAIASKCFLLSLKKQLHPNLICIRKKNYKIIFFVIMVTLRRLPESEIITKTKLKN